MESHASAPAKLLVHVLRENHPKSFSQYAQAQQCSKTVAAMADALDELRECAVSQSELEQIEDRKLIVAVLNQFLSSLPKRDRVVFVRRYWYFAPISEIAREYGLSQSNAKTILSRARAKLKTALEAAGINV